MTDRERIGLRIKEIRTEKGLSQLQLALSAGLRQQHIARIESGKHSTGIETLSKIADALECRVDILYN